MSSFSPKSRQAQILTLQYAFFRWESAILIAGAILLTWLWPKPFPWWPIWGWGVLGLAGVVTIFVSSLTNARGNADVLLKLFQSQFNLRAVRDLTLRQSVASALEYQRRIEAQVRSRSDTVLWDRPEDAADQMNDWVSNMYRLAQRLDAYRRDTLLGMQRTSVPKELDSLKLRRSREANTGFQEELDRMLDSKQKQWDTLQALDARMKQAELQIEQSLTALATIDNQVRLIDAQEIESGRSERMRADIVEQVNRLNDLVTSINEVYDYRTPGLG
jgi:hypothetical protein